MADGALHTPGAGSGATDPIDLLGLARRDLTDLYAEAVAALPAAIRAQASVIGAHGQTIRHRPEQSFSLQILDGARLAEATGLPVVTDFRSADLAAGGQGAPLAPLFHQIMPATASAASAVVNVGGIANVTVLAPADTAGGTRRLLAGFDTGPGNRLLDDWCQLHRGQPFDANGQWAASGKADSALLTHLLADPFFGLPAPKSTGREDFSLSWLQDKLRSFAAGQQAPAPADVQATLVELTAASIIAAVADYRPAGLVICGGGAANPVLMQALNAQFNTRLHADRQSAEPPACVSSSSIGIDPQQVEAAAFGWLAQQRLQGLALDLSATTGASAPRILGAMYLPPPR